MPVEFGSMTTLQYLSIGSILFNPSSYPIFINEMTNLKQLILKQSSLTGTIPQSIRYLSNLEFLDLRKFFEYITTTTTTTSFW